VRRLTRKQLALAASTLIVLVGAVILVSAGLENDTTTEDGDMERPSGDAQPVPSEAPSFVPSGRSNIYAIEVDTGSLDQLTRNEAEQTASQPVWSAQGTIVFSEASSGDEPARLFLVNPDGSGRRRVPTHVSQLFQPTWAADGRKVAAVRLGAGIYVVDTRTGSARRLRATRDADDAPVWSPDGKSIVFQRQVTPTNWDLYRIGPTGSGLRRLTRDSRQQVNPAWSPDGSRLAFSEQQRNGNWAVSSMKVDGSNRKLLTDPRLSSQEPSWSPDGEKIAFVLQQSSRQSIAVIDAGGGRPQRISPRSLVAATHPSWSPDSKKVTFAARRAERPPPGAPSG
jgi:TolB protein